MLSTPMPTPSIPPPSTPRVRVQHLAYALDALALNTMHTIQDSHVHLSMPPPSTPARTRSTPMCTRSTPIRMRTTLMRTLAHMHRPDALHPWPLTRMQACKQVQGAWKSRRGCRHVCRGSVACGGFTAHGGVQKECQQGTGAARCADAPWRL